MNSLYSWNDILDTYLTTGKMDSGAWEFLSDRHKEIINEIKKSIKRIKAHEQQA